MDWNDNFSGCCGHSKRHHHGGCCPKRCDDRFHGHSFSHGHDCGCSGKRRSVIVECHKGNCNEVRRHHCCDGHKW
ncbi:MAG TPA: hypothetical protein VNT01_06695 [Symbiobacteriaceae bacterium]|nr:hypothetical protein [Symbiobacteriaceae bacterium]